VPYEDVPGHLRKLLWSWIAEHLSETGVTFALGLNMRLQITDPRGGMFEHEQAVQDIQTEMMSGSELMLDSMEWLLENNGQAQVHAQRLEAILALGELGLPGLRRPQGLGASSDSRSEEPGPISRERGRRLPG
jgi:hypothetical protein